MVEWIKLGDICEIKTGRGITQKDCTEKGLYPVISGGQTPMGMYNQYNREAHNITISRVGANAGYVSYIWQRFYLNDKCFSIIPFNDTIFNKRYLYIILKNKEDGIRKLQSEGGVPTINTQKLSSLIIPVPSVSEQNNIVDKLDSFTSSIDNLKQQIAQRRKQYEYYREQIINSSDTMTKNLYLGDIAIVKTGTKPAEILDVGIYKYINAGTTESGFVNSYNCDGDVVTTPSRGQGGIGFVGYQSSPFWLGPLCYQIRPNNKILVCKYLFYYLSSHNDKIMKLKSEGGTPAVNRQDLIKIKIPVPSLSEQQRIVDILDKFEASIQNLEAQLSQREKQYEYYRNKLLTFE